MGVALWCDVPECSLLWKIKQGSLEILNNSQTFGRGQRLGAENDQCLSGREMGLESLTSHKPPGFLLKEEGGGAGFHISSRGAAFRWIWGDTHECLPQLMMASKAALLGVLRAPHSCLSLEESHEGVVDQQTCSSASLHSLGSGFPSTRMRCAAMGCGPSANSSSASSSPHCQLPAL